MTIMTKQLQVTAEAVENIANINSTFADRNGENTSKGFFRLSKVIRKMLLAAGTADGFNRSTYSQYSDPSLFLAGRIHTSGSALFDMKPR